MSTSPKLNKRPVGRPPTPLNAMRKTADSLREAETLFGISRAHLLWAREQNCPFIRGHRVHRGVAGWLAKNPPPAEFIDGLEEKELLVRQKMKKEIGLLDLYYEHQSALYMKRAEPKSTWAAAKGVVLSVSKHIMEPDVYAAWLKRVEAGLKGLDL